MIGGDPSKPLGPYEGVLAVIWSGLLAHRDIRQIGIAGYPEGHPRISPESLSSLMIEKLDALAQFGHAVEITTQFAFDSDAEMTWLVQIGQTHRSNSACRGLGPFNHCFATPQGVASPCLSRCSQSMGYL